MKTAKRIAIVLVVLFVVIQVIRPSRTNPPVDQTKTLEVHSTMTPGVAMILGRACADCHSSNTDWPWYAQMAPVSWLLASDVNGGRQHWSASDWMTFDAKKRSRVLEQMCEEVQSGAMPPSVYLLMHRDARLSDADKQALCAWSNRESSLQK